MGARATTLGVPGLADLLQGKVHGRGRPEDLAKQGGGLDRRRIERLVKHRAPEVMIKVRRGGKSAGHVQEHLAYISRNGQVEAENERGERILGRAAVRDVGEEWGAAPSSGKPSLSKTVNMILSMPAGTNPERLRDAARAFAKRNLSNHHYLFALHTSETDPHPDAPPHPHVHLSALAYGFDGRRLNPDKAMLQRWREDFAQQLRERGIEAEATPRRTRGVVRKQIGSAEWHVERRAATKRGDQAAELTASRAKRKRMEEIAEEFRRGDRELKAWEHKALKTQLAVRQHWLGLAAHFKQSGRAEDLQLAECIVDFVNRMPAIETERMASKRQMGRIARSHDVQREPDGKPRHRAAEKDRDNDRG